MLEGKEKIEKENMNQSVLKGDQIYSNLAQSLESATSNIIVVTAWFTDETLLDILTSKVKDRLEVSVIIGDNKDNEKLDFKEFEANGGQLVRVKGKGFGMMHQKYCVIDKKIAFHGSYNWTVNARKNNSESVIKTNHKDTIKELVEDFKKFKMEQEIIDIDNKKPKTKWLSLKTLAEKLTIKNGVEKPDNSQEIESADAVSLDDIFKSIISAEIKKTNRSEIKDMAYSQAKEVSGDSQVITKFMDSLYHLFISDKNENNQNKERLLKKIDDKVAEITQSFIGERDKQVDSVEIEMQAEEKGIEYQKNDKKGLISKKESEKKHIIENLVPQKEKEIDELKEIVDELDIEFVKPKFKYHEFIPLLFFFTGLSLVMFLFYSSSAYIMLYSYDDAMLAIKAGLQVNPQVYEAEAIPKALEKGGTALLYIFLFVFIPFAIAYEAHNKSLKSKNKLSYYFKKVISYAVVIGIDFFIAFKVSETIREINYLSKGIDSNESFFQDVNFWLVFFLGAIPFFFLSILLNKLIEFFAERNSQVGVEKMQIEKKLRLKKIKEIEKQKNQLLEKVSQIDLEINNLKNEFDQLEKDLIFIPKDFDLKKKKINRETDNRIATSNKKADLYKNDIENDNVQISMSSLKDRVSAFIEGWNEWLHDEYSTEKAQKKSSEAMSEVDKWLEQNLKKIDK